VGIGVVMLRKGRESGAPEVLLVRRAKPPEQGKWTVPGGSLELGETMVECAIREAYEETGMRLRNDPQAGDWAARALHVRCCMCCLCSWGHDGVWAAQCS
jgi:ADP-ribose pyrophosphatase YjhB (NUDIX family)